MAPGIELAAAAMICYGLVDWIYKRAAQAGVAAHQMLMSQALFFAPGIFVYGIASETLVFGRGFAWGLAAGAFIFVALYYFNRSLGAGAVSIMAPIFRLSFGITAALAVWLLDEPLTLWKTLGLALALISVLLLVAERSAGDVARRQVAGRSIARVLIATVAMGLVSLFYKLGAQAGGSPASVLCGQASVFAPCAVLFCILRDRGFHVPRAAWGHAVSTALLLFVGVAMLIAGLARGDASTLVPIAQLSFVVTALLGLAVQREAATLRKLTGLACAIGAMMCLALG